MRLKSPRDELFFKLLLQVISQSEPKKLCANQSEKKDADESAEMSDCCNFHGSILNWGLRMRKLFRLKKFIQFKIIRSNIDFEELFHQ